MLKCGMKYEGTMRQDDINNQGICDTVRYAISRRIILANLNLRHRLPNESEQNSHE